MSGRILLIDDDDSLRRVTEYNLVAAGFEVMTAASGKEGLDGFSEYEPDLVVTDVELGDMNGLELMQWAQEHCPQPLWIILSGLETFDAAVDALQLGAFDYLAKPPEVPRVRVAVRNALDPIELVRERKRLYAELENSNAQLAEKVTQLQKVYFQIY